MSHFDPYSKVLAVYGRRRIGKAQKIDEKTKRQNSRMEAFNKLENFLKETRKNLFITIVTSFGLSDNAWSRELISGTITLEELFK